MNELLTSNTKQEQRLIYSKKRNKVLSDQQLRVFKKVLLFIQEKNKSNILKDKYIGIYWPIKGEVDVRDLKKHLNIKLALPASRKNKHLSYHPWLNNTLKKDIHSIPAPLNERELHPSEISTLLVPALSIDKFGIRLGYGGGFFDILRKEKSWRSIPSYVIISHTCFSNKPLPKDVWDIPFDGFITEKGFTKSI